LNLGECFENCGHSSGDIFHSIASCQHDENGDRQDGDILLVFYPFVSGEQEIKSGGCKRGQQRRGWRSSLSLQYQDGDSLP